jgi:TonB family protein
MRSTCSVIVLLLWVVRVPAAPGSEPPRAIVPTTATSASAPTTWSADYAGRIRAAIVPFIAWTEEAPGNPVAEVEIRTSPDGIIVQVKVLKSSGVESWDQSVQTALAKVGRIPLDVNGQAPPVLVMSLGPRVSPGSSTPATSERQEPGCPDWARSFQAEGFPKAANDAGVTEGRVTVEFILNTDGSIGSPKIVQSTSSSFDDDTLERTRRLKCVGANRPRRVRFTVEYRM